MILEVVFAVIILSVMAIFAWESALMVDEKKNKHGVSSGEQQSKKKHMDDIL
jgi:hypothetical protein|tara:strand:- start:231 stop:386 length:156 start_codon:yes stop_codon:yes gene_type:complete